MTDERAAELLSYCDDKGAWRYVSMYHIHQDLRDLLATREQLRRVIEASAKYRCLTRSDGPRYAAYQAGAELDSILESLTTPAEQGASET